MSRTVAAAGFALSLCWLAAGPAAADTAWTSDSAQGITEYRVDNAAGDSFTLSCDVEASANGGEGTAVVVTLGGKDPAPDSTVTVMLDGTAIVLAVDKAGVIGTDCPACAKGFRSLWGAIRAAGTMRVQYGSGPAATFPLANAASVLPELPCKTAAGP